MALSSSFLILLTSITTIPATWATDAPPASAVQNCLKGRLQAAVAWYRDPSITRQVDGYWISGAIILDQDPTYEDAHSPPGRIWVAADFYDRAGIIVPPDAIASKGTTYRYYRPDDPNAPSSRKDRGAGRDHLLVPLEPGATIRFGGREYPYESQSDKGSGTSAEHSDTNGKFDLKNYRTNGLQTLEEVLVEKIAIKNLSAVGFPVVPVPKISLAPESFQGAIGVDFKNGANDAAAQTRRIQELPRDSYLPPQPEQAPAVNRIIAMQLFYGIVDGAINPENMAQVHIADPGHVSTGYPITPGEYRCLVCQSIGGSTADRAGPISMADYYYSKYASPDQAPYSYNHPTQTGYFELNHHITTEVIQNTRKF